MSRLKAAEFVARLSNDDDAITDLLGSVARGDAHAADALLPKIYESLRAIARKQFRREGPHTLQTTALVHETYLELLSRKSAATFASRAHFYAYASRAMRHILVDHARRNQALKRQPGPGFELQSRDLDCVIDMLALDEALTCLSAKNDRLARVAELKLFAELSNCSIADLLVVDTRTIERDWLKARTFLSGCLAN